MTRDELNTLLSGESLLDKLDVKTLVLDSVQKMSEEEIMTIFWSKLSDMTETTIRDYFYMRRS
jgi:hypothetical protein